MSAPFDLLVTSELWKPAARWRTCIGTALDACASDAAIDFPDRPVSIMLCDDDAIRALNRDFRGKDSPTNVLSFPAATPRGLKHVPLGDIAIAWETVAREAHDEGKSVTDHVTHLAVHGALHLVGFDHETEKDAEDMEAAERRILASIGIADPYRESEPVEISR